VQEERLCNVKNFSGVPELAIKEVFKIAKIHPHDINVIAMVSLNRVYAPLKEMPLRVKLFMRLSPLLHGHSFSSFYVKILHKFRPMQKLNKIFSGLGIDNKEVVFVEHQKAHAACAFYSTKHRKALVFTSDGAGDGLSSTVNIGVNNNIKRIASSTYYDSLSNVLYSEITRYLGMKPWEHEFKCVKGDTPVLLSDGKLIEIKELFEKNFKKENIIEKTKDEITVKANNLKIMGFNSSSLKIKPENAKYVYRKKFNDLLYEITTHSGRKVVVTNIHKFQTIKDGFVVEKQAKELTKKDYIAIPKKLNINGTKIKNEYAISNFLAGMISEGWEDYRPEKGTDLFYFANNSNALHTKFQQSCSKLFGVKPNLYTYKNQTPISRLSLLKHRKELSAIGYEKNLSENKKIPDKIMKMSKSGVSEFLKMFCDCDGGVIKNKSGGSSINFTTISKDVANKINYLLLRFGIVSRNGFYKTRATNSKKKAIRWAYVIKVMGTENIKRFMDNIGFVTKENNKRAKDIMFDNPNTHIDVIPCVSLFKKLYDDKIIGIKDYLTYYHDCRQNKNISVSKLKRFLTKSHKGDKRIKQLRLLVDSDIFWDKIKDIKKIKLNDYVYDLYVPKTHTFIGGFGGIVLHNTMGMAPYGKAEYCIDEVRKIIRINPRNPLEFQNTIGACGVYIQKKLIKMLAGQRFDNISAACQLYFEELMEKWVRTAVKKTGIHDLVFAGGSALNVKANKIIREMPEVDSAFFYPASDDGGTPVGAALEAYNRYCEANGIKPARKEIKDVYYGMEYSNDYVKDLLKKRGWLKKASFIDNIDEEIGEMIAKGNIIARCSGRVEWGPRALGNRSIMADPRDLKVIGKVNFAIKQRDFWMPFAVSILEKRMKDYLIDAKFAPYMIEAFDTTEKVDDIIAGTHPFDKTARPQIVNEWNPGYKKIIETFEAKTGIGAVLNTSFNLHGSPLIGTPDVAISTLENSGLKWLVLGNYLINK